MSVAMGGSLDSERVESHLSLTCSLRATAMALLASLRLRWQARGPWSIPAHPTTTGRAS